MRYSWVLPERIKDKSKLNIYKKYNLHPILAEIIYKRKIDSPEKIEAYFSSSISHLYDPFLMADMEKAVNRIIKAMQVGENILIYGDYDVDGVTGVSILYDALFKLGGKVSFFIPSRFHEGYGLSIEGIKTAQKRNVSLIIAVDCGITAIEEIKYALDQNIDTIICDHHEPLKELPQAAAILDPKVKNAPYPFKELAGCGMAFKLLQALVKRLKLKEEFAAQYLDMVALGTAADIVQLVDENRVLVKKGLELIADKPRPGIFALLELSGMLEKDITVSSVVFTVAPRVNAVGRISNAKKAVHLLTTKSLQQARNIARILEKENQTRKSFDEQTFLEAQDMVDNDIDIENKRILVLAKDGWHPGVVGIVASRILEKYNRPAVLISLNNGMGRGSARSTSNFDIYAAFNKLQHLFTSYGGHQFAAGLTISEENVKALDIEINEYAEEYLRIEELVSKLDIDAVVSFDQFNASFFNGLKTLAPFGPGNMRPVFASYNLSVYGRPAIVGSNHLKIKFKQNSVVLDAIGYNLGDSIDMLKGAEDNIACAYVLEESRWSGQTTIQMIIKDIKVENNG